MGKIKKNGDDQEKQSQNRKINAERKYEQKARNDLLYIKQPS